MIQRLNDWILERRIEACMRRGLRAKNKLTARIAFSDMAHLIRQRSPSQIAMMERTKGLR